MTYSESGDAEDVGDIKDSCHGQNSCKHG